MTALLLVVIYIAFIGLGIPDSLFGTAWPAIYQEFKLPLSAASYVTVLTSLAMSQYDGDAQDQRSAKVIL